MKKLLITVVVAVVAVVQANGQGLVDFRNRITGTLDAPVRMPVSQGGALVGDANFVAQLWFSATETGSYTAVSGAASAFRTGTGAGYWNAGTDSTRQLVGITPGTTAWLMVRVWNITQGADYATAIAAPGAIYGSSLPFSVTAGGTPPVGAPLTPAAMLGLAPGFNLVPEPSTIALGVLGVAGLLFIRRRK